jgi:hypothetical protein
VRRERENKEKRERDREQREERERERERERENRTDKLSNALKSLEMSVLLQRIRNRNPPFNANALAGQIKTAAP